MPLPPRARPSAIRRLLLVPGLLLGLAGCGLKGPLYLPPPKPHPPHAPRASTAARPVHATGHP